MGLLDRLWGNAAIRRAFSPRPAQGGEDPVLQRWDASRTTRLNSGHWAPVTGETINTALASRLGTLRDRCAYELANNGDVEGMIERWVIALAGKRGPTLQVRSGASPEVAAEIEAMWSRWCKRPEIRGKLSLSDLLKLWGRQLWTTGEILALFVRGEENDDGVALRIQNCHPRRLGSVSFGVHGNHVMGIDLDAAGRPLVYHIEESIDGALRTPKMREWAAADVLHAFVEKEAEQVRGVPWLASVLGDIADLRDYDAAVLRAARLAAKFMIGIHTDHQDAEWLPAEETYTDIPEDAMVTLPPGYRPSALKAEQPATNYVDFRRERQRGLGAPRAVPLMVIRNDASQHNYSSARIDNQALYADLDSIRGWLEDQALDPMAWRVIREWALQRGNIDTSGLTLSWMWPQAPHVDPVKEAEAQRIRMSIGVETHAQACVSANLDPESQIAALAQEAERFAAAGLPHPMLRDLQPATPEPQGGSTNE